MPDDIPGDLGQLNHSFIQVYVQKNRELLTQLWFLYFFVSLAIFHIFRWENSLPKNGKLYDEEYLKDMLVVLVLGVLQSEDLIEPIQNTLKLSGNLIQAQ